MLNLEGEDSLVDLGFNGVECLESDYLSLVAEGVYQVEKDLLKECFLSGFRDLVEELVKVESQEQAESVLDDSRHFI